MLRNRKKLFIGLLFLFSLGAAIGWFVLFDYSARWLEGRLNIALTALKEKGYTISYSTFKITGTPFSVRAILQNPYIKDPQALFEWSGQEVDISLRPWKWGVLKCTFLGDHKVFLPQNVLFTLGILHLEGAKGKIYLTSKGQLDGIIMTVARLSSFVANQPQSLILQDVSLRVNQLLDPLKLHVSFTTHLFNSDTLLNIASHREPLALNFEGYLSGFQPNVSFPKSLAEWRDGGGVIEVSHLKLEWPPIIAEAQGTLALDEDMYPLGSFSAQITGYQEALADLVQLGWVKKKNAKTASFVVDLFSSSDEKGIKRLKVPITLQNKRLFVGPASLFKFKSFEGGK